MVEATKMRTRQRTNGHSAVKKLVRLDIACGSNKTEGFFGIDIAKTKSTDLVWDVLKYPWPLDDESVSEAVCNHFVEHIPHSVPNEPVWFGFWDEVYRVLVPGGKIKVVTPYYSSMRAVQDPGHVRMIAEASYLYCNYDWLVQNKLDHYPCHHNFDFTYGYSLDPMWAARNPELQQFAIRHHMNSVSDLVAELTKKPMPN